MTARFSREFQVSHSSDKEEGRRRSLKKSFNHFALVATHCFVAVLSPAGVIKLQKIVVLAVFCCARGLWGKFQFQVDQSDEMEVRSCEVCGRDQKTIQKLPRNF
jgi:hypothetical protein